MEKKIRVAILSEDKDVKFAVNEILKKTKNIKVLKNKLFITINDLFLNLNPDIFIFTKFMKKDIRKLAFLKQNMIPCIFFLDNDEEISNEIDGRFYPFKIIFKPLYYYDLILNIELLKKNVHNGFYQKFMIGDISFHPSLHVLLDKKREITKLTDKESLILEYFFQNKNIFLSKEKLLLTIWGYKENISTNTLETHIYRLRKKLSLVDIKNKLIMSKNGGYIFVC